MAIGLMDENQQPSVQQELEKLFPSTRGAGSGGESREHQRVGEDESSASAATDTNISFLQDRLPQNGRLQKYGVQKLVEIPVNLLFFSM